MSGVSGYGQGLPSYQYVQSLVSSGPLPKRQKTDLLPSFRDLTSQALGNSDASDNERLPSFRDLNFQVPGDSEVSDNERLPSFKRLFLGLQADPAVPYSSFSQPIQYQDDLNRYDPTFNDPNALVTYAPSQTEPVQAHVFPGDLDESFVETTKTTVEITKTTVKKNQRTVEKTETVFKPQTIEEIKLQFNLDLTKLFRLKLGKFDLTPASGWGEDEGTWRKRIKELDSEFSPNATQDIKEKVKKAMTFFTSPTGAEYVFVNRYASDLGKRFCDTTNNAYLNSNYKRVTWDTSDSQEINWVRDKVVDLCRSFVPQEYEKTYPKRHNNGRAAYGSIDAAFACYVKAKNLTFKIQRI